jgi:hypothetical protein
MLQVQGNTGLYIIQVRMAYGGGGGTTPASVPNKWKTSGLVVIRYQIQT